MKYLIASIVGAVIGYITNWLAIKMLFRPHNEVRVLGVKMPFTPGLIPKERLRISKSVGQTIGEHLLTKETIVESLCSKDVNDRLKSWVKEKVDALINSSVTVGEKLKEVMGSKYETFSLSLQNKAVKYVLENIRKEENINSIAAILRNQVNDFRSSEEFNKEIESFIEGKYMELTKSGDTLAQAIPSSFISTLKVYIYNKNEEISLYIKQAIKQEKFQEKLKAYVAQMISANLNPMMAMFINIDSIFEKINFAIEDYLDNENNRRNIALIITNTVDEILKHKINNISSGISEEGRKNNIHSINNIVLNKVIDDKLINSALDIITEKFKGLVNCEKTEKQIESFIQDMANKLAALKLNEVFSGKEEEINSILFAIVSDGYNKFIENKAADVVEMIDIPKIVEEKINSFDVAFAEKIILDIASKELSAITWLGALLGAIMGILSPVLSALY